MASQTMKYYPQAKIDISKTDSTYIILMKARQALKAAMAPEHEIQDFLNAAIDGNKSTLMKVLNEWMEVEVKQ